MSNYFKYQFKKIKQINCTKEQIEKILETVVLFDNYKFEKPPMDKSIRGICYIEDNPVNLVITGRALDRKQNKVFRWTFAKDGREPELPEEPARMYREMKAKAKFPDIIKENSKWDNFSSKAINESSVPNTETRSFNQMYAYDTNLTYFHLLSQNMPDTAHQLPRGVVEAGQVGFRITGATILGNDQKRRSKLELVDVGTWADFRFPLIDSPFLPYVQYKLKQLQDIEYLKATDPEQYKRKRGAIKGSIVISVGNMQHHNPILRAYIVETANKRMLQLKDSNTIAVNTDCIYSTVPRPDIPISDKIGDFKIEHQGSCTVQGTTFRWADGDENQRGFKNKNIYRFNRERMTIDEI